MNLIRRHRLDLLLFVCVFALFGAFKWKQYRDFGIHDYDTGIYSNVVWNVAHGNGFYSAINEKNQLGEHFSPIMAAFAPFYRVWPSALVILLAQAAAVALGCVLFYELALILGEALPESERRLFAIASTGMGLLYLPLMAALMYEFHPSTLGVPMLAGAIVCLHRKRMSAFWVLVAVLLTTKEVAILSVAGLGLYAGLVLRRYRLMIILFAVAAAAAAFVFGYFMPAFRDHRQWGHMARFDMFSSPVKKLKYIGLLFVCLGLTPLFSGRALWSVLPTTLLNLTVKEENQFSLRFHYDDQNGVFWIVAGMYGLLYLFARIRRSPNFAPYLRRAQVTLAVLLIAISFAGGGVKYIANYNRMYNDGAKSRLRAHLARYAAMPDASIVAITGLGPYLCHRERFAHLGKDYVTRKPYKSGDYLLFSLFVAADEVNVRKTIARFRHDRRLKLIETHGELTVFQVR